LLKREAREVDELGLLSYVSAVELDIVKAACQNRG
jgi:hypothetical protein